MSNPHTFEVLPISDPALSQDIVTPGKEIFLLVLCMCDGTEQAPLPFLILFVPGLINSKANGIAIPAETFCGHSKARLSDQLGN